MSNPERITERASRSTRKQSLIDFTQREMEQYESGQINRISSIEELKERFGYTHKASAYNALRETELYTKRREIKKQERQTAVPRVQELLNFVSQEIERYKNGEISTISSAGELGARFGYASTSTVYYHLKQAGLNLERSRLIKNQEQENKTIIPSTEWAWMMGILAGGGHIDKKEYITFCNRSPELREAIKSRGERLFNANATTFEHSKKNPTIAFGNKRIASELGNFTRDQYVTTVTERHGWILGSDQYVWSFLEGIFETRGRWIGDKNSKFKNIVISATRRNEVNFLSELLVRVGINNPRIHTKIKNTEILSGLYISFPEDIKLFSENVHSVIPKKEEHLAFYREMDAKDQNFRTYTDRKVQRARTVYRRYERTGYHEKGKGALPTKPKQQRNRIPEEELISEWEKMIEILGHIPNVDDVQKLRERGETKYSANTYTRRFGKTEQGFSFKVARDNLVRRLQEVAKSDEQKQNLRLPRSVSSHMLTNEEAIAEWARIVEQIDPSPNMPILVRLFEEGKIKVSPYVFRDRFGQGSFVKARENLEKLAFGKKVNDSLQQYEHSSGRQIRYAPKIHRPPGEDAKRRLNQITGYTEQLSTPQVSYGHDGESIIFPPARDEDRSAQRYTVDPVTKLIVLKEPEREKYTSQETQIFP